MSQIVKRTFFRAARQFSSAATDESTHAGDWWSKLALFGVVPSVVLLSLVTYVEEVKHHHDKRPEHIKQEHDCEDWAARQFASSTTPIAKSAHSGGMDLWRKLALFGAVPVVVLLSIVTYVEAAKHHHDKRPEYIEYDYLRKRDKRYPWGDGSRTLFHNPHTNWHPDDWDKR